MEDPLVQYSFSAYLNRVNFHISPSTDLGLPELLYLLRLRNELKQANKVQSVEPLNADPILLLTKVYARGSTSLKQHLSVLSLMLSDVGLSDMETHNSKCLTHLTTLISMQSGDEKRLPRFGLFLLQNVNRVTLRDLSDKSLPIFGQGTADLKLMNFLLDHFVCLVAHYKAEFEVNLNAVLNAPNIELALAQMIKFQEAEDRVNTLI